MIDALPISTVSFDYVLEREERSVRRFCELARFPFPGLSTISDSLQAAQAEKGIVTIHDRFLPEGLKLSDIYSSLYNFNAMRKAEGGDPLKLIGEQEGEWWRQDGGISHIPTEMGIFTFDSYQFMRPTDISGRPFGLDPTKLNVWAIEQGGSGLASMEEVGYLWTRWLLEYDTLPWGMDAGIRCCNLYSGGRSMFVRWSVNHGLGISFQCPSENTSAIPRILTPGPKDLA